MKKILQSILVSALTFIYLNASATTITECKTKLDEARATLVAMLGGKKDVEQQKKVSTSANDMSDCLNGLKVEKKDTEVAELKKVYAEFKNTRETELVPLILSTKVEDNTKAKTIGTGIQKERMDKMNALIKKIQGGDL